MNSIFETKRIDVPVMFKAGTVIFKQGSHSRYLYLVKKGEVILVKAKGQKLSAIDICEVKDILNEVAVLTGKPNDLTAIAKTDVELVLIDQKDVLDAINSSPSWVPDIFQTLCERLKSTQEMIEEHNLAGDKDARLLINREDELKYLNAITSYNS